MVHVQRMAVLVAFVSLPLSIYADVAGTPADEAAIRKFVDYTESLGFGGAETRLSAQFTAEKADFINIFGGWTQGRIVFLREVSSPEAIAFFKGKTREHTIESVRFLRPDVAIAIVKFYNSRDNGKLTGEETRASYLFTKEGGRWKLNAFHNTVIVPGRGGNPPKQP